MPRLEFTKEKAKIMFGRGSGHDSKGVDMAVVSDLESQIQERQRNRCCNRCHLCFGHGTLALLNFIDLAAGCVMLVWGVYYEANNFAPPWLYVPLLSLGATLVCIAGVSMCSLEATACACCCTCLLKLSGFVAPVLCTVELVSGAALLVRACYFQEHLRSRSSDRLHIPQAEIDKLQQYRQEELKLTVCKFASVREAKAMLCSNFVYCDRPPNLVTSTSLHLVHLVAACSSW
jgi:hypothetical protein